MGPDFTCARCGSCCRHDGEVRLAGGEADAIAAHLGISLQEFIAQYTRLSGNRLGLSLTDQPDGSCIFLSEAPFSCRIQASKPAQCRAFPLGWHYEDLETVCQAAAAAGVATL